MTTPFTTAEVRHAIELLASRSLIRLVTDIDDNGAIPPRRLVASLPDLSAHQLRRATDAARAHGLVRTTPGSGLELTESGSELADLYDAAASWGRRRAQPEPVCEFSGRIRHVLDILAPSLMTQCANNLLRLPAARRPTGAADADLAVLRALLIQWLAGNPQVARASEPEQVA